MKGGFACRMLHEKMDAKRGLKWCVTCGKVSASVFHWFPQQQELRCPDQGERSVNSLMSAPTSPWTSGLHFLLHKVPFGAEKGFKKSCGSLVSAGCSAFWGSVLSVPCRAWKEDASGPCTRLSGCCEHALSLCSRLFHCVPDYFPGTPVLSVRVLLGQRQRQCLRGSWRFEYTQEWAGPTVFSMETWLALSC